MYIDKYGNFQVESVEELIENKDRVEKEISAWEVPSIEKIIESYEQEFANMEEGLEEKLIREDLENQKFFIEIGEEFAVSLCKRINSEVVTEKLMLFYDRAKKAYDIFVDRYCESHNL